MKRCLSRAQFESVHGICLRLWSEHLTTDHSPADTFLGQLAECFGALGATFSARGRGFVLHVDGPTPQGICEEFIVHLLCTVTFFFCVEPLTQLRGWPEQAFVQPNLDLVRAALRLFVPRPCWQFDGGPAKRLSEAQPRCYTRTVF